MFRQLYLVSTSSLFVGFLTGFFVYFQNVNEPVWQLAAVVNREAERQSESNAEERIFIDASGHEIVGTIYGGCERTGCPSYRIRTDGTYTFLTYTDTMAMVRIDDALSAHRLDTLENLLDETDFDAVMDTPFTSVCPTTYDGLGYRYELRLGTTRYRFDSCEQDLTETILFSFLKDQFEIFRVTHRSY